MDMKLNNKQQTTHGLVILLSLIGIAVVLGIVTIFGLFTGFETPANTARSILLWLIYISFATSLLALFIRFVFTVGPKTPAPIKWVYENVSLISRSGIVVAISLIFTASLLSLMAGML
jgi:hypothetical protein